MKVKFKSPYFGPGGDSKTRDGRHLSGVLYDAGVHDNVPDDMPLPKSAEILDRKKAEKLPLPERNPIHQHDLDRAAGEAEDDAADEAAEGKAEGEQERVKRKPGRPKKYA